MYFIQTYSVRKWEKFDKIFLISFENAWIHLAQKDENSTKTILKQEFISITVFCANDST